MPWVRANCPATGDTPWLNIDIARTMMVSPDGATITFGPNDFVTVKEDPEILAATSRAHWIEATSVTGEALWINTDVARTITVAEDGTVVTFDAGEHIVVRQSCDLLIGARTRLPRMR
jgi:hypothetical protein